MSLPKTVQTDTPDAEVPTSEWNCPMPNIAQLIGGKWKLIVLQILIFQGTDLQHLHKSVRL